MLDEAVAVGSASVGARLMLLASFLGPAPISFARACPQCRVTSSYYIPHKYWVSEGAEKEKLIKTFKARTG